MWSGERPIGAAKSKQTKTMASCQPPPPWLRRTHTCNQRGGGHGSVTIRRDWRFLFGGYLHKHKTLEGSS